MSNSNQLIPNFREKIFPKMAFSSLVTLTLLLGTEGLKTYSNYKQGQIKQEMFGKMGKKVNVKFADLSYPIKNEKQANSVVLINKILVSLQVEAEAIIAHDGIILYFDKKVNQTEIIEVIKKLENSGFTVQNFSENGQIKSFVISTSPTPENTQNKK